MELKKKVDMYGDSLEPVLSNYEVSRAIGARQTAQIGLLLLFSTFEIMRYPTLGNAMIYFQRFFPTFFYT